MRRTDLSLIAGPSVVVLAMGAIFGVSWSELPDPIAIHWGLDGSPDGSAPRLLALGFLVLVYVAMAVAVHGAVRRARHEAPSFTAGLFGIGGLLIAVTWLTVNANKGVDNWTEAGDVTLLHILVAVVVAGVLGMVGWLVAGGRQVTVIPEADAVPALDLIDPQHAVWSGRGVGRLTTAIGVAMLLLGLFVWGWTGVVLIAIAAVALMFASVQVTVSQRGVVVSLGWWGYPNWRVPLGTIGRAEVEQVNPMAYGGWGYRLRPGVRAVVVRGGDALKLVRSQRYDLVYTVDDAETGAGLLNAIVGVEAE